MQVVQIPLPVNESIYFDYAPPPTFAGHLNRFPFKVNITSSNDNEHVILLDARYSRSYEPSDDISKWSFLRPEFKFLDLSGNKINSIKTNDTKIYFDENGIVNSVSGIFMGVTGYCEFYFIDDLHNFDLAILRQPYSTIIATLQTSAIQFFDGGRDNDFYLPNFSNSRAVAYQPHIFTYRQPDYIKISETGKRDYINPRWNNAKQPILFTLNWNKDFNPLYNTPSIIEDGNQILPVNPEYNFCHHIPDKNYQIPITVQTPSNLEITFDDPLIIKYTDENGYKSAGYCKTFFNVKNKDTTVLNSQITASIFYFPPDQLYGNSFNPKLWIPNPNAGVLQIVEFNYPRPTIEFNQNYPKAQVTTIPVPIMSYPDYEKDNLSTIGFHGLDAMAVLPPPIFQAWGADRELNYLYRFSTSGKILCAIDINQVVRDNHLGFFVNNQVSPNSISLDGELNVWMTLYDSVSVLKFNKEGVFQFALNPCAAVNYHTPPNLPLQWNSDNKPYGLDQIETQNFMEPTYVETDMINNLWVSFSNYASGYIIKYDPNGNILNTIYYPTCASPQQLISDNEEHIWVALSNNEWPSIGSIEKRRTNGFLVSSYGPIRGLNKITLDKDQNIWFTHSYGRIATISNVDSSVTDINILDYTDDTSKYAPWLLTLPDENESETAIEGITCDQRGFIYVLNSVENRIYIFDYKTKQFIDKFHLSPEGFNFYPTLSTFQNGETNIQYNYWAKSIQASGDWAGFKWLNKYEVISPPLISTDNFDFIMTDDFKKISSQMAGNYSQENPYYQFQVTGVSRPLNFYPKSPDIFKINENFDMAGQMKSTAFMPTLQNSPYLFDIFLNSIFSNNLGHEDLGVKSYEKISNFNLNKIDVDTCEIDDLYNLADSINENTDDYRINYPLSIQRLMNLVSINKSRLWGSNIKSQNNFKTVSDEGLFNRGDLITLNYMVTAGTPVVLKTKSLDSYDLIPTGLISGLNVYPLETLVNFIGLPSDWLGYYSFYEFIPSNSSTYLDSIIDWNNPNTTLNQNVSTFIDWLGHENTVDQVLSYELYKGLGLLNN